MTIGALIITYNEERNIERCIRAVQSFADEIIVLDSFSTDKTPEICKLLGVKFIQREWAGYSAAKNFLNDQCSCDYIFSIDADEAPDQEMQQQLLEMKSKEMKGIYSVNRITNYCGKWIRHSGWFPDIKVRLFPKGGAKWTGELVHEELSFDKEYETRILNGLLEHYSYYSAEEHRKRADKYSELTARKYHEQGKKAGIFKPLLSCISRFVSMYFLKKGFLDGRMGLQIAWISALSNRYKYSELRRLNRIAD
jgi:(heptosyl)LPS beta-1,4-glucosyltransferase